MRRNHEFYFEVHSTSYMTSAQQNSSIIIRKYEFCIKKNFFKGKFHYPFKCLYWEQLYHFCINSTILIFLVLKEERRVSVQSIETIIQNLDMKKIFFSMCARLQYSLKVRSIKFLLLFFINASLRSYKYEFKRYSAEGKKIQSALPTYAALRALYRCLCSSTAHCTLI